MATHLTEAEARLICDALGDELIDDPVTARMLWAEVEDAVRFDRLDRKWGVNGPVLVARLRMLSGDEALAVCRAVERYRRAPDGADSLDRAGFRRR
jgi:hypothetical protein